MELRKKILYRWISILTSFVLVVGLFGGMPGLNSVVQAEEDLLETTLSLASAAGWDNTGGYVLTITCDANSDAKVNASGWSHSVILDGEAKAGNGTDWQGVAYSGGNLIIGYEFLESGATSAAAIGGHIIKIPKGTEITYGNSATSTLRVAEDFIVYINGTTVKEPDFVYHDYNAVINHTYDGYANTIHFTSIDSLTQGTPTISAGKLSLKRDETTVLTSNTNNEYFRIEKPFSDSFHIAYGDSTNPVTPVVGDVLTFDCILTDANGYAVYFNDISYRYIGMQIENQAAMRWQQAPEIPETIQTTWTSSTVTLGVCSGQDYVRFLTNSEDAAADDSGSKKIFVTGGLYKNGEAIPINKYTIEKINSTHGYHIDFVANDLAFVSGDILKLDAIIADEYNPSYNARFQSICFSYDGSNWSLLPEASYIYTEENAIITTTYDNATNALHIKSSDGLQAGKTLSIVEGEVLFNGSAIQVGTDTATANLRIEKPWSDGFHMAYDNQTNRIIPEAGDILTFNCTITDGATVVQFDNVSYEYYGYDALGNKWHQVLSEKEPDKTHSYTDVTFSQWTSGNCLQFTASDELEVFSVPKATIASGDLYIGDTKLKRSEYTLEKLSGGIYHLDLSNWVNAGNALSQGTELKVDVILAYPLDTDYRVQFSGISFVFDGTATWTVQASAPEATDDTFTVVKASGGYYDTEAMCWNIPLTTSENEIARSGATLSGMKLKITNAIGGSSELELDGTDDVVFDGMNWVICLPIEDYPQLPTAADMQKNEVEYRVTVCAGEMTDSYGSKRTAAEDVVIALAEGKVLGVLAQEVVISEAINYDMEVQWFRFDVAEDEDVIECAGQRTIVAGGLYVNDEKLPDSVNFEKLSTGGVGNTPCYHMGLDGSNTTTYKGDRVAVDCYVANSEDAGVVVKFTRAVFEKIHETKTYWTLIDEANDIRFTKLDTVNTQLQTWDDGSQYWYIYLYVNRTLPYSENEEFVVTGVDIDGVTHNPGFLVMEDGQRVLLRLPNDSTCLQTKEDGSVTITIPKQPNLSFKNATDYVVNLCEEFTFYLYSNETFGTIVDGDGAFPGDVNNDIALDSLDIVLLKKYIADIDVQETVSKTGLDANSNGSINERDVIKLYEYILEGYIDSATKTYVRDSRIPVYLDDEDMWLAAYEGPRSRLYSADGTVSTVERTDYDELMAEFQRYKEAGFNTVLQEGEAAFNFVEGYTGADVQMRLFNYMKAAQEVGLNVVVCSQAVNDYLQCEDNYTLEQVKQDIDSTIDFLHGNNIVTSTTYGSNSENVVFDNFIGFLMSDELDNNTTAKAHYKELKEYMEEAYENVFGRKPVFMHSSESQETVGKFTSINRKFNWSQLSYSYSVVNDYNTYSAFLTDYALAGGYVCFDRYPFRVDDMTMADGSPQGTEKGTASNIDYLDTGWLMNLELAASVGKATGTDTSVTLQSCAFTHATDKRRTPNLQEIQYEVYTSLAYGMSAINYFTYWMPFTPNEGEGFEDAMIVYDGDLSNNTGKTTELYTSVQATNMEISKYDHIFNDFAWQFTNRYGENDLFLSDMGAEDTLADIDAVTYSNSALISQMYDEEKGLNGYWVVNATDPQDNVETSVELTFDSVITQLIVVSNGTKSMVTLGEDKTYTMQIGVGEGTFVIPIS